MGLKRPLAAQCRCVHVFQTDPCGVEASIVLDETPLIDCFRRTLVGLKHALLTHMAVHGKPVSDGPLWG